MPKIDVEHHFAQWQYGNHKLSRRSLVERDLSKIPPVATADLHPQFMYKRFVADKCIISVRGIGCILGCIETSMAVYSKPSNGPSDYY